jgi:hypothetical protein
VTFKTAAGTKVTFMARPTGGRRRCDGEYAQRNPVWAKTVCPRLTRQCGPKAQTSKTPADRCIDQAITLAEKFCAQTSKTKLQEKLCLRMATARVVTNACKADRPTTEKTP